MLFNCLMAKLCQRKNVCLHQKSIRMIMMFILVIFSTATAQTYSGLKEKVNYEGSNVPVVKFIQSLQQQAGYVFSYEKSAIDDIVISDINLKNSTLGDALQLLEKKAGLSFQVYNKNIGVQRMTQKSQKPAGSPSKTGADKIDLKGQVTDSVESPLINASITIKGNSKGTFTDSRGNFAIGDVDDDAVLVVSYAGYITREIPVNGLSDLKIILKESSSTLNAVVVTALGIERQSKSLGYSTQRIKAEQFENSKDLNLANAMVGKVAGLEVNASTEMFISSTIKLRGGTPLIVVDGTPINTSTWDINYNDIESLDVLKGSTAASLYGSAGINGALIITLKKGRESRSSVEFTSTNMIQPSILASPHVQTEFGSGLNGQYQYVNGSGAGIEGGGFTWGPLMDGRLIEQWNSPVDQATGKRTPIPWVDHTGGKGNLVKFLQTGFVTANNINFEAGNDKGSFRMSATQEYQKGIVPNTSLNLYGFSLSGRYRFSKWFQVNSSLNYSKQTSPNYRIPRYGSNDYIYSLAFWLGTDIDLGDAKNYWVPGQEGIQQRFQQTGYYNNPYFLTNENINTYDKDAVYGQLTGDVTLIPNDLALKIRIGANNNSVTQTEDVPKGMTGTPLGNFVKSDSRTYVINNDAIITYNKKISENFSLNALAGASYFYQRRVAGDMRTNGLVIPLYYNMSNSINPATSTNSLTEVQTKSLYANVDLQFWKPLYLSITGRNDWVSTLPVANNSYFYPSASLSLVLSDWLNLPKAISFLKVRSSLARVNTGNTGSAYSHIQTYTTGSYNNMATMQVPSSYIMANLLPSSSRTYEIGGNIAVFNNRLGLDVTYFNRLDYNNIISQPVSMTTGYSSVTNNGRKYTTEGWEFGLNAVPVKKKNFRWDLNANIYWAYRYLTEMEDGLTQDGYIKVGSRADQIYARPVLKNPQGQVIIDAGTGLSQVDAYPRYTGNFDPDFAYGIQTRFSYKSFSLSLSFDGRKGGKYFSILPRMVRAGTSTNYDYQARLDAANGLNNYVADGVVVTDGSVQYDGLGYIIKDTRVYAPNTKATNYQSYQQTIGNLGGGRAENFLDADYLKLRELALTWSLPAKFIRKLSMTTADFSIFGSNLLLFTKRESWGDDPSWLISDETQNSNLKSPTARSIGFQLKIRF